MIELTIRAAAVEQWDDVNAFAVVLNEAADGSGDGVELQRSLTFDDQDVELGMDTYCLVTSYGASFYGGIESCILDDRSLTIRLSQAAQRALGIEGGLRLSLDAVSDQVGRLGAGLMRVFADDPIDDLQL